jgi:hypothetical protein
LERRANDSLTKETDLLEKVATLEKEVERRKIVNEELLQLIRTPSVEAEARPATPLAFTTPGPNAAMSPVSNIKREPTPAPVEEPAKRSRTLDLLVKESPPPLQLLEQAAVTTPPNPGKVIMILSLADIPEDYYSADLEIGQTFQPIPTTPLSVKRAPLSDLKKFKGHRNVVPINRWINTVESFGRKNRIQPGDMVSYLDSILSGTAEAWFHKQYAVLANTPGLLLWRTWWKKLLTEFVNDVQKSNDLKEFNNLNYLDFASFLEYANCKYFLRSQVYGNSAHFLYPESRLISEMYELLNVMVHQTLQQTYQGENPTRGPSS